MKRLVIDIETVGTPWEEHDPYVREYLIKGMNEAEAEEEKRRGALSPFTGRIVAIGIVNVDNGRSAVLYEVPGQEELITKTEGSRTFISGTEKLILQRFWKFFGKEDRFITFNGRQFDGPYIMIRSAINGIAPKRDLLGPRYSGFHLNCDLREVLSFCGTINTRQIRFNLDLACKAFGIESSKSEGMDGRAVETMYRAGRFEEIARYCLEDVRATAELYEKLAATILALTLRDSPRSRDDSRFDDSMAGIPASEQPFLTAISETSVLLSARVDDDGDAPSAEVIGIRQQMGVLEKLTRKDEDEEVIE